jgi:hypothetical protein
VARRTALLTTLRIGAAAFLATFLATGLGAGLVVVTFLMIASCNSSSFALAPTQQQVPYQPVVPRCSCIRGGEVCCTPVKADAAG